MYRKQHRLAAIFMAMLLTAVSTGCGSENSEESYRMGYDQGYADGLAESEEQPEPVEVTVSGDFTATVRSLVPAYGYDSKTFRSAIVTLFQGIPLYFNWMIKCVHP